MWMCHVGVSARTGHNQLSGGIAKLQRDVGIKVGYLIDLPCKLHLGWDQMACQGTADNFAVGFQDVGGQHRPHIHPSAKVLTKDPAVAGPFNWHVNKENPLVPGKLVHVTATRSESFKFGLRDQPITVVHDEGAVGSNMDLQLQAVVPQWLGRELFSYISCCFALQLASATLR